MNKTRIAENSPGFTTVGATRESVLRQFGACLLAIGMTAALNGCSSASKKSKDEAPKTTEASAEIDGDKAGAARSDEPSLESNGDVESPAGNALAGPGAASKLDKKYEPLSKAVRSARANLIIDEASKILGTNQYDPVALNTLAMYHFRKQHSGAAKLLLNRALDKNTNSAALYNNFGVVLLEEGDFQGAMTNFKKALRIDPNHPQANGNIGSLYVQSGDYAKALPLLESAYRQLRSTAPGVATNYAVALRANKDFAGAQRVYEEVLKTNSRDVPTLLNFAILDIDYMNKPKEGLALVYKVKFIETDKRDILDRASALEKKAKALIK